LRFAGMEAARVGGSWPPWTAVVAPVGQLRRVVSSKQRVGDLF